MRGFYIKKRGYGIKTEIKSSEGTVKLIIAVFDKAIRDEGKGLYDIGRYGRVVYKARGLPNNPIQNFEKSVFGEAYEVIKGYLNE